MIAGFDRPSTGRIMIGGAQVSGPGPDKAMVFQDYVLLPWLNARENVEIGLRLQGLANPGTAQNCARVSGSCRAEPCRRRPSYKLSGGNAAARIDRTRPRAQTDRAPHGRAVRCPRCFPACGHHRELLRIWQATEATIIFVTHSLEEALVLGARVFVMTPGTVGFQGETSIELKRPRDPLSPEFLSAKRALFGMLTAHLHLDVESVPE